MDTPSERPARRAARVVAVSNQKGGVAKTTTAVSLATAWAELGLRVLLVDLDPQACLTFSVGFDPEDLSVSLADVLAGGAEPIAAEDVLLGTEDGPDVLPASIDLAGLDAAVDPTALADALATLRRRYDLIVIDCPPSLGALTVAGLTAADRVLIPLQCETLAHRGVGQLLDTVHDVRRSTNRSLRVLGVLPTLFDGRSRHANLVLERISDDYGVEVLEPAIPRSIRFAEAPATGRSALATARNSRGARAYRDVASRLLRMLG